MSPVLCNLFLDPLVSLLEKIEDFDSDNYADDMAGLFEEWKTLLEVFQEFDKFNEVSGARTNVKINYGR